MISLYKKISYNQRLSVVFDCSNRMLNVNKPYGITLPLSKITNKKIMYEFTTYFIPEILPTSIK